MREKVSAPITSAFLTWPRRMKLSAAASANTKPEQTAPTSIAKPLAPSTCCTRVAVAGNVWSGVQVPSTMQSMSLPLSPAFSSAWREAAIARSEVSSPSAAM